MAAMGFTITQKRDIFGTSQGQIILRYDIFFAIYDRPKNIQIFALVPSDPKDTHTLALGVRLTT